MLPLSHNWNSSLLFCFVFLPFLGPLSAAHGGFQAKGLMGAVATSLRHSHNNAESKPHLQPTPQLTATPDPQPTEQGQGSNPTSWFLVGIVNHCATTGTPVFVFNRRLVDDQYCVRVRCSAKGCWGVCVCVCVYIYIFDSFSF